MPLKHWQEIVGRVDDIRVTSNETHIVIDGYDIDLNRKLEVSEGDTLAIIRTAKKHIVYKHE